MINQPARTGVGNPAHYCFEIQHTGTVYWYVLLPVVTEGSRGAVSRAHRTPQNEPHYMLRSGASRRRTNSSLNPAGNEASPECQHVAVDHAGVAHDRQPANRYVRSSLSHLPLGAGAGLNGGFQGVKSAHRFDTSRWKNERLCASEIDSRLTSICAGG